MKVDKKTFVKILNRIQEIIEYEDQVSELGHEHNIYVQVDGLETIDYVLDLLELAFTPDTYEKQIDDISYFVFETDFGKKILERKNTDKPYVVQEDGKDISDSFTSAEKLYDYLISLE